MTRLISAAVMLLLLATACSRTPDEQQVREAVKAAAEAAELLDAGSMQPLLSPTFQGNDGALDAGRLVGMLRVYRLRGEDVGVLLGPIETERRGDRIVARFTATLSGGGRLLPEELGVWTIESAWREEDGLWRCYTAHWKRAL